MRRSQWRGLSCGVGGTRDERSQWRARGVAWPAAGDGTGQPGLGTTHCLVQVRDADPEDHHAEVGVVRDGHGAALEASDGGQASGGSSAVTPAPGPPEASPGPVWGALGLGAPLGTLADAVWVLVLAGRGAVGHRGATGRRGPAASQAAGVQERGARGDLQNRAGDPWGPGTRPRSPAPPLLLLLLLLQPLSGRPGGWTLPHAAAACTAGTPTSPPCFPPLRACLLPCPWPRRTGAPHPSLRPTLPLTQRAGGVPETAQSPRERLAHFCQKKKKKKRLKLVQDRQVRRGTLPSWPQPAPLGLGGVPPLHSSTRDGVKREKRKCLEAGWLAWSARGPRGAWHATRAKARAHPALEMGAACRPHSAEVGWGSPEGA